MAWETYRITPLDTVFFREGRSFVAGEGANVESIFPPLPLTLQGLIRTTLLTLGCAEGFRQYDPVIDDPSKGCQPCRIRDGCVVRKVVGNPDGEESSLRIRGPWLLLDGKPLVPCPADLIARDGDIKKAVEENRANHRMELETRMLAPIHGFPRSNMPGALNPLEPPSEWREHNIKFEAVNGWITWERFREYLGGDSPYLVHREDWWFDSDLWSVELRSGLEIEDQSNRAAEGNLYFAKHVRLEPKLSLAVELDGLGETASSLASAHLTPFGGERRSVVIEKIEPECIPWREFDDPIKATIKATGKLKLILTQMTWFKRGWIPGHWSDGGAATIGDASLRWMAARVERPELIGGWDHARKRQKPIRRFLPRGSIFYLCREKESDLDNVLRNWSYGTACLTDTPEGEPFSFAGNGLGQFFFGTWKEEVHV